MLATFLAALAVGIALQALKIASRKQITVYIHQPDSQAHQALSLPHFINSKEGLFHHDN